MKQPKKFRVRVTRTSEPEYDLFVDGDANTVQFQKVKRNSEGKTSVRVIYVMREDWDQLMILIEEQARRARG